MLFLPGEAEATADSWSPTWSPPAGGQVAKE